MNDRDLYEKRKKKGGKIGGGVRFQEGKLGERTGNIGIQRDVSYSPWKRNKPTIFDKSPKDPTITINFGFVTSIYI